VAHELGLSIATGAVWMVGVRWMHRFVGLISIAVVARLLAPEDFGLVALATTVVAFLELFGQVQVDVALMRTQGADRDLYNSAWTLELLRGIALTLVLAILASPAAAFFSEPRVRSILYVIAVIQLLSSLQNIGTVEFRKELRFEREFLFEFSARIVGATLTIAAAYVLRNHWALVVGLAFHAMGRVSLSFVLSSYRPRLCFTRFGEIFHFSKWMILQNFAYGVREQVPTFAVSRLLHVEVLGFFNAAREISALVTTELRAPIRRALYPGFTHLSMKSDALKVGYIDAFAILLLLSLPISAGLFAVADLTIAVFLGQQWMSSVPLVKILAMLGIVQSFGANTPLILNRIGRPELNAVAGIGYLLIFIPALFWATARYGVVGTAWALVYSGGLSILTEYALMRTVLRVRFSEIAVHCWRPILAAACMLAVLMFARNSLHDVIQGFPAVVLLAGMVVLGAIVYCSTALFAWWMSGAGAGAERRVLEMLTGMRPRIRLLIASSLSPRRARP
jgi:lipopolysaccharide exporter